MFTDEDKVQHMARAMIMFNERVEEIAISDEPVWNNRELHVAEARAGLLNEIREIVRCPRST